MMIENLVSVIIPVYNVEKYLRECLDSVVCQTYSNLEIIIVDDGSTDNSYGICKEYELKDDRIRIIRKENGGLSSARNAGLSEANGEYVYFLDSDDYIDDNSIELLAGACGSDLSFVFFDAVSFVDGNEDGSITQRYKRVYSYPTETGRDSFANQLKNKEFHYSVPLLFIRREFLTDNGLVFQEGIEYEDVVFTYELFMLANKTAHLNIPLYHRRYRENSIVTTKNWAKKFQSIRKVYNFVCDFTYNNNLQDDSYALNYVANRALNTIDYYNRMSGLEKKEHKSDFDDFLKDVKEHSYFGNNSLKYRTKGKLPWLVYKVIEKVFC